MAITIIGGGLGVGKIASSEAGRETPKQAEHLRKLRETLVAEVCEDARELISSHDDVIDHPEDVSMSFLRVKDFVRASATERHQDVPFRLLCSLMPEARLAQSMIDKSLRIAELQEQYEELKRLRNIVDRTIG
tara:strand:+ start:127179 stop:127577 length:399 start_codon:yes stop_codon:yes gene_type:complete